jgi:hypothetical protein
VDFMAFAPTWSFSSSRVGGNVAGPTLDPQRQPPLHELYHL